MLVLGYSESELNSACLVGFLSLLERFLNFLRISINHLDRLGKKKLAGSFGSVCWYGSLGGLICLCWFLVIRSRN